MRKNASLVTSDPTGIPSEVFLRSSIGLLFFSLCSCQEGPDHPHLTEGGTPENSPRQDEVTIGQIPNSEDIQRSLSELKILTITGNTVKSESEETEKVGIVRTP